MKNAVLETFKTGVSHSFYYKRPGINNSNTSAGEIVVT
jgi:hypothetical protein